MAKGKDHKSYEYGTKASIVSTYTKGIIVGVDNDYIYTKYLLHQTLDNTPIFNVNNEI
jgi:IS5 family transposase